MFDAANPKSARRDRSLLSLRDESAAPSRPQPQAESLLSIAGSDAEDAISRHRRARSRREAAPSPLLGALAGADDAPRLDDAGAAPGEPKPRSGGPVEAVTGWFGRLLRRPALMGEPVEPRAEANAPQPPVEAPPAREAAARSDRRPAPSSVEADTRSAAEAPPRVRSGDGEYWQPLIDPLKVIGGIVRSRWLILATTVAGSLIGVFMAMSTPKIYEAYAELLVDPRDLKLVERELTTTGLPSDATLALVENQVRVLTSSTVLNKVVDRLSLDQDPEFNGQGGGSIGLGTAISLIRSLFTRQDGAVDEIRKRSLAVEHLGESLSVERGGKTFIIVITVKTQDAEKSALIANTMSDVFMQTSGELQSDTAGRATDELTARLDTLREEVGQAERAVAAFKAEHDIVDPQGRLITDDEIVKVNDQLAVARARTIELNARAANSRGVTAEAAARGSLPEELTSPVMIELRSQYAALKQEADRIAVRLGPRHPTRLAADAQVAGALDSIAAELRRISASLQVELTRAVEQEQSLAARLAQLKARQGGIGDDLVTLRELEREATAQRAVYEAFLLRARETAEQRDINAANVTVISPAFPPLDPSGPGRSTIAAGGTIMGLLFGIGIGAMRGGWESLRESMAGRPRRRRRMGGAPAGKGDDTPPEPTPPGNRAAPKDKPVRGEGADMGLFSRIRRAATPAEPAYAGYAPYAPPGHQPATAGPAYAPPSHVPPPAPAAYGPAGYPPAQAYAPVHDMYGRLQQAWAPPAPAPHMAHGGWAPPPAAQPHYAGMSAHPGYGPPPHTGYVQPPVYAQPYAPVQQQVLTQQGWQQVPAWAGAPAPTPQPVYYAGPAHFHMAVQAAPEPVHAEPRRPAEAARAEAVHQTAMEEIRDSLREFREAVQDLADTRQRRRA